MTLKIGCGLTALKLLTLCELTLSAAMLARSPSSPSPNDIPQETIIEHPGKYRNEKSLYSLVRQLNTNVEKPNTDGYRLLEIELHGAEDVVDETNLRGLVRAMLSGEEQQRTVSEVTYPHPEVIAHSILGVRDIGLSPNHRINPFVDDNKDKTIRPSPDEKLYYLKNTRPKVDVNVRGHSGSFIGDSIISKTARDQSSIIRPPGYSSRSAEMSGYTKSLLDKSIRRPKKYESPNSSQESFNDVNVSYALSGTSYGTGDYEPTPITIDRPNNESTTENMSVTSSELPKQIPAPPSRLPSTTLIAQTTPVQKYALRRTDILPGYSYGEA